MRNIGGLVRSLRLGLLFAAMLVLPDAGSADKASGKSPAMQGPAIQGPAIQGKATVLDGDTLEIGGRRYDIQGIDAPELDQTCLNDGRPRLCGVAAAFELKKIIALGAVACSPNGEAAKATLVSCFSGSRDVAEMLLSAGEVVTDEGRVPGYVRIEEGARAAGLGLWRGAWIHPRDWRKGQRSLEGHPPFNSVCMIKGVLEQGEKMYLLPTGEGYADRKVSRPDGETMLCTIAEAEANGWRRLQPPPK